MAPQFERMVPQLKSTGANIRPLESQASTQKHS